MTPLDLYERGFSVFPCTYGAKRPSFDWHQYQTAQAPKSNVEVWFKPGRLVNAAAACGFNGLVVIDFDDITTYGAWIDWALTEGGIAETVAAETYRVLTSRGMHLYITMDKPPRTSKFKGGDVKGQGGYVLIPPSLHPSGTHYTEQNDGAPFVHVDRLTDILPDVTERSTVALPKPKPGSGSSLFPKTTIERIKENLNIIDFFPGAKPSGGGRWYVTRCPWHDDHAPSFRIDSLNGMCYCWSGCTGDRGLDVIGVYAKVNGIDIKEAINRLKSMI